MRTSCVRRERIVTASRMRVAAVMALEIRTQRREPLTALYALVLGLLAAAFAAAGPVELVRGRGAVPRDAAWSLWLAGTAMTAFGQVITTMVAATVVLRDRMDRVDELLVATRLTRWEYLLGKLLAALVVLCLIYAVIPLGFVAGASLGGGTIGAALRATLPPFVLIVLPTMLAVGALQFATGVLSGRLWAIVAQGLLLIWLWSACADAATSVDRGGLAALLDPFGSAIALRETGAWSDAERAMRAMPISAAMFENRALWLIIGGAAAALAILRGPVRSASRRAMSIENGADDTLIPRVSHEFRGTKGGVAVRDRPLTAWQATFATARFTLRWMLRDAGWRVLAALGAVNVGLHAFLDARGHSPDDVALVALHVHARIFLILLATIYAGEVVWRERDDRSAPLFDGLPIADHAVVGGRVIGVIIAQLLVSVVLIGTSLLAAMAGAGQRADISAVFMVALTSVTMPFAVWMLLALAIHSVLQQKVVAHLCCIALWVLAVLTAQVAALPERGEAVSWRWVIAAAVALVIAWLAWVRGEPGSIAIRCGRARRRAGLA